MKNKFFILVISVMILMSCASNDQEESEPAEVILYRMAQDRINAKTIWAQLNHLQN